MPTAQHANAEKSKTVKSTTWRGMMMIRDNKAFRGALPKFWETRGERYRKQAYCADPGSVRDIYERVANRESLLSIGRRHGLYAQAIKTRLAGEGREGETMLWRNFLDLFSVVFALGTYETSPLGYCRCLRRVRRRSRRGAAEGRRRAGSCRRRESAELRALRRELRN